MYLDRIGLADAVALEDRLYDSLPDDLAEIADRIRATYAPIAHHGGDRAYDGILDRLQDLLDPADQAPPTARGYQKASISAALRREVFERDAYRCQYCGGWTALHAHHVVPETHGGPTEEWNLVAACAACNLSIGKRFRPPAGWAGAGAWSAE